MTPKYITPVEVVDRDALAERCRTLDQDELRAKMLEAADQAIDGPEIQVCNLFEDTEEMKSFQKRWFTRAEWEEFNCSAIEIPDLHEEPK